MHTMAGSSRLTSFRADQEGSSSSRTGCQSHRACQRGVKLPLRARRHSCLSALAHTAISTTVSLGPCLECQESLGLVQCEGD